MVTYCTIPEGFIGEGNIMTPPHFVDAAGGDYRPAPGSAAIDAGNGLAYVGLGVDRDGKPRLVDDPDTTAIGVPVMGGIALDMGAYEYQPLADDTAESCPGDLTGDGAVDVQDLVQLVLAWGICP